MSTPVLKKLRIHSILFLNEPERIEQTIEHLDRAVDHVIAQKLYSEVTLVYGDCSQRSVLPRSRPVCTP